MNKYFKINLLSNLLFIILQLGLVGLSILEHSSSVLVFVTLSCMFVAIVIVYFNILKISNMQKAPVVDAWLVGGCVGGSLVTYLLNHDVQLGPVGAAATVGTVAGMIPARYLPSGNDFRLAVYCGAFVGMSSQQVINGYLPAILAGLLCGCVYLMATGTLVGYGGKLGTIAFAGVNMCSVVIHLLRLWNL